MCVGPAHKWLILDSTIKQAKLSMRNKSVSNTSTWPLLQLLPWVPALTS